MDELHEFLLAQVDEHRRTADRLLLAFFHTKQGSDVEALEQFRTALAADSDNAAAWFFKAEVAARTLDFDAAIADLERAKRAAPDAKLLAELETLAKRGGFATFEALEIAVANITFVMSGIDENDGSFREPVDLLRQELVDTEADKQIKGDEKAELIASIKESIAHTPRLAHRGNVAIVNKHFKALARHFDEQPG